MKFKDHPERKLNHFASIPFIYGMIVPFLFLDIMIELYHNICFRLYKLPLVKRSRYIRIDRHRLEYLTWREKMNCAYCGYANGLIRYSMAIVGETEKYWCGIRHKRDGDFYELPHQKKFLEYGDEEAYAKISNTEKNEQLPGESNPKFL